MPLPRKRCAQCGQPIDYRSTICARCQRQAAGARSRFTSETGKAARANVKTDEQKEKE